MLLALYVPSSVLIPFFCFCGCCVSIFSNIHFMVKVRFINFERTKLPEEILKHNLEEKRKYFSDICLEVERSDAEVQVCSLSVYFLLCTLFSGDDICNIVSSFFLQIFSLYPTFCMTQAEGVYNQRLQNLAVTLDKVICALMSVLRCLIILFF